MTGCQKRLAAHVVNAESIVGKEGDDDQHHIPFDIQAVPNDRSRGGEAWPCHNYRLQDFIQGCEPF